MTDLHWASTLVGQPWVAGVSDCWHFAAGVWRERYGWVVPASGIDPGDHRAIRRGMAAGDWVDDWERVEVPIEGDAVLMRRGRHPCHVGLWIDAEGGAVLHAVERAGVICTVPSRLAELGLHVISLHRWRGACGPR